MEETRRLKPKRHYNVVIIPDDESKGTKTFSVGIWFIVSLSVIIIGLIVTGVIFLIIYTPVGSMLPIKDLELEHRYSQQVLEIQKQLNLLTRELLVLRSYNLRLRKALGENVSDTDTTYFTALNSDTLFSKALFDPVSTIDSGVPQGYSDAQLSTIQQTRRKEVQQFSVEKHRKKFNFDQFPFTFPSKGYIVRGYSVGQDHYGIDISGKRGAPIVAAASGVVIFADWTYDDGYKIIIAHNHGFMTIYKHNQVLLKHIGSVVKRGEIIALLGSTGKTSRGPHLHFEIWQNGTPLDPIQYLLTTY